jgi:biopolymer transport protein ExbD
VSDASTGIGDARVIEALRRLAADAGGADDGAGPRPQNTASPRRSRPRRRGAIGAALRTNMAPMIDVVFLLLVFFMATTQWARDERVIAMDLAPRTAEAGTSDAAPVVPAPRDPFVLDDESLMIAVRADGTVMVGAPYARPMDLPTLRATLREECRGVDHPKGMFEPSFPIVIDPDRGAPWETAVAALDAATAAGFRNVGFARGANPAGSAR